MRSAFTRLSVVALFAVVGAGCSCLKKEEFNALKMEVEQNKRISEQALNTANEARAQSQRTEEAVSRSFKKSMYK